MSPTRQDPSLSGRTAVITGASRNIGAAIARTFADAGADLLLVARGADRLEAVADDIRQRSGRRIATVSADLRQPAGVEKVIAATQSEFGAIDVLVNNAYGGGGPGTPLLENGWEVWENEIALSIHAPFRLMQALAPGMIAGRGGSVINLLTAAQFVVTPTLGPYAAAKSALWTMTRYLAVEYAPKVRFNCISPGTTQEDETAWAEQYAKVLPGVPLRRLANPAETAAAALFLASDASSYITGQVINVDGGRVAAATVRV